MLLGLGIAGAIGVTVAVLVVLVVGNPQFVTAGSWSGLALIAVYGLVPSLATGLASVSGGALALQRYDPALDHPEPVRDRLVGRGATLGAGGAWLVLTLILGLASPDSWAVAAAMVAMGVAVALTAGWIAVAMTRAADRRSGIVLGTGAVGARH